MNIIHKVTLRQLKRNKKRTMITIFGVIIASAMITAVTTAVASLEDLMLQRETERTGKWHLYADHFPFGRLSEWKEENGGGRLFLGRDLGYALLPDSANEDKPYLYLEAYDAEGLENRGIRLLEGRLPRREDEIVLPVHVLSNGLVELQVGDTLRLAVGERKSGGYSLNQTNPYEGGTEVCIPEYTREYQVVGIMERPSLSSWEPYSAPGYTAVTFLGPEKAAAVEGKLFVFLNAASEKSVREEAERLSSFLKQEEEAASEDSRFMESSYPGLHFNHALLNYYGWNAQSGMKQTFLALRGILILIIMIGAISLIHNAFSISLSERSRYLGMLSSVGATKKQKRSSVFFEGAVIGGIGIPIGIAAGYLGLAVTFALIRPMVQNLLQIKGELRVVISWPAILAAFLISAATIFLSAWFPALRASRLSPIDAIRQSQDIRLTRSAVRTSRLTGLLFGLEGELALKNIKRNKKRYRSILFSLLISLVLFLSVAAYSSYMRKAWVLKESGTNYDVKIEGGTWELYQRVLDWPEADEAVIVSESGAGCLGTKASQSAVSPEYVKLWEQNLNAYGVPEEGKEELQKNRNFRVHLYAMDDAGLKEYARSLNIEASALLDAKHPQAILINKAVLRYKDGVSECRILKEAPSPFTLHTPETDGEGAPSDSIPFALLDSVILVEEAPMGLPYPDPSDHLSLVVSKEVMDSLNEKYRSALHSEEGAAEDTKLYIRTNQPGELSKRLVWLEKEERAAGHGIFVMDHYAERRENAQLLTVIDIFSYGFITLMALICAVNIFNGISTGMALRKRELAALKSAGMTPGAFRRMLSYESLFYGLKALLYGLPASFAMMLFIRHKLSGSFRLSYGFPWAGILFAILAVFLVVGLSMGYSFSRMKKENIIDALREENI